MDEDYGGQLADRAAHDSYFAENNMCPECETKYDDDDYCNCEEE